MTLRPARDLLADNVAAMSLVALAQALFGMLVFDWSVLDVVVGGAIGAMAFGAFDWLMETNRGVPTGDATLPAPPPDAEIATARDPRLTWRWLVLPGAAFAIAWLARDTPIGGIFVPGMALGYAASNLLGLVAVRRWEERTGRSVLITPPAAGGMPQLYAG